MWKHCFVFWLEYGSLFCSCHCFLFWFYSTGQNIGFHDSLFRYWFDSSPFYCHGLPLDCHSTNFLRHSFEDCFFKDDSHDHNNGDDGDHPNPNHDDDDHRIHSKPLFPAPHCRGRQPSFVWVLPKYHNHRHHHNQHNQFLPNSQCSHYTK